MMDITLLIMGILVIIFALTGHFGQGKLTMKFFGEKNSKIINILFGIILVVISFFV